MKDLKTIKALVLSILESDPRARNSDYFLYFLVIKTIAEKHQINLKEISITDFLLNLNTSPFPPFESVRRSRQKIQEKCPWLAASPEVEEGRAENEHEFREFAKS